MDLDISTPSYTGSGSLTSYNYGSSSSFKINGKEYKFYSVYYPVGNGSFNAPKAIEDLKYILNNIMAF